ncbi:putative DNA-directed RNA polymerase I subunit beta, partial [Pseudovirgaria hyperparasitica]
MAPPASKPTSTKWSTEFDTLRRQHLFRNPPKDHTAYPMLAAAIEPHVNSFNAIFEKGGILSEGLKEIGTKVYLDAGSGKDVASGAPTRNRLSVRIKEVLLEKPELPPTNKFTLNRTILPAECRERHSSYRARLRVRLEYKINSGEWLESVREFGQLPVMLRTNRCHLQNMTPYQLVKSKEESEELGGYFIVNGIEKLIRMLILTKRNYPLAINRPSFTKRGPRYTKHGILLRSARPDETSQTICLHYLNDGNVTFRCSWRKNEYLIPVSMILKALVETNDREIFEGIVGGPGSKGLDDKQFVIDRVEAMIRTYKAYNLNGRSKTRAYLGNKFKVVLQLAEDVTDEEAGTEFLRRIVLPHLGASNVTESQDRDKFRLLLFMIKKLFSLVEGECAVDNPDAVQNQEVLLGGFLYSMILKEKLEEWLLSIRLSINDWLRSNPGVSFTSPNFASSTFDSKILKRTNQNIGQMLEYFLATGNLTSVSGLDLQQVSGFTVAAEKLNFYRFISHFRMIHRGSFFAELRTTTVRKLLPESWGFLCPVHTPDGAPCGLLNHLSHTCKISTKPVDTSKIPDLVAGLGIQAKSSASPEDSVVVQLDGRILGFCAPKQAKMIAQTIRYWKVEGTHGVPLELEVGYIPNSNGGTYPGVYMFSHPARFYRPVKYLPLDKLDYVGPFEQPYMSIACREHEIESGDTTHVEYDPTNILSIVANMTPFSDFNQSPRNMYQCQMGKQTMGTPGTALRYRTDNKTYRLQAGQTPIVRAPLHNDYGFDNFPNGTNAVVAVISYTGYDMDDAMILNKSGHERGFGHGSIYKTKKIPLEENNRKHSAKTISKIFGIAPGSIFKAEYKEIIDVDGLPIVGAKIKQGDPIAAYHNVSYDAATHTYINNDQETHIEKYKDDEDAFIEEVRLIGSEDGNTPCQTLSIKLRIPRSPIIGDKFSSRHGQKGVCSQRWPSTDMPFSESGIQPDVIINPHAFPSRMTIGMFVESLAGKSGALHGLAQDSTPWRWSEDHTAVAFFGDQLRRAGYNYYGNEPMYSGITGEELAADIYIGVVYYQRLRHMVNDKYQVRTTGPVVPTTGQPIKGRKKGGGIRVGEMERDALIAHGAAYLLQDRLMNCSDYQKAWCCRSCGGFLATLPSVDPFAARGRFNKYSGGPVRCRRCARRAEGKEARCEVWEDGQGVRWVGGEDVTVVAVPGVLRLLDCELASMGVRMRFGV